MNYYYRVRDYSNHFESAESKRVKNIRWMSLPVRHDGKTFRRIMAMDNGAEVFACFVLILQVASRTAERGSLLDGDGPITAEDLYFKTGMRQEHFETALEVLCSERINWLEKVSTETLEVIEDTEMPSERQGVPSEPQGVPSERQGIPSLYYTIEQDITGQDITGKNINISANLQASRPSAIADDEIVSNPKKIYSDEFEEFWKLYPRTEGKRAASKQYKIAVKELTSVKGNRSMACEFLRQRVAAFKDSPKALGQFCWHGSTWLSGGHYDDSDEAWYQGASLGGGGFDQVAEIQKFIDRRTKL